MGGEIPARLEESPSEEGSQQLGKLRQGGCIPNWGLVTPPYPRSGVWPTPELTLAQEHGGGRVAKGRRNQA